MTGSTDYHKQRVVETNIRRGEEYRRLGVKRRLSPAAAASVAAGVRAAARARNIQKVEELGFGHSVYYMATAPSGYVVVGVVDHPIWGDRKGISLHRLLAGEKIGRRLRPDEEAHHIDEDKSNNDPDNIEVLTVSEHKRHHMAKWRACPEFRSKLRVGIARAWAKRREEGRTKIGPLPPHLVEQRRRSALELWERRREAGTAAFGPMPDTRKLQCRTSKTASNEQKRIAKYQKTGRSDPTADYLWVLTNYRDNTVETGVKADRFGAEMTADTLFHDRGLMLKLCRIVIWGPAEGFFVAAPGRGNRSIQWVPRKPTPLDLEQRLQALLPD